VKVREGKAALEGEGLQLYNVDGRTRDEAGLFDMKVIARQI
jgi:hypothetical protein